MSSKEPTTVTDLILDALYEYCGQVLLRNAQKGRTIVRQVFSKWLRRLHLSRGGGQKYKRGGIKKIGVGAIFIGNLDNV